MISAIETYAMRFVGLVLVLWFVGAAVKWLVLG